LGSVILSLHSLLKIGPGQFVNKLSFSVAVFLTGGCAFKLNEVISKMERHNNMGEA
jgi:hypothetical protein